MKKKKKISFLFIFIYLYYQVAALKQKLYELESNMFKSISINDICEMFKYLNKKVNKKDIEEIMWEVDEDLNGRCDWNEFKLMFTRNLADKSGIRDMQYV